MHSQKKFSYVHSALHSGVLKCESLSLPKSNTRQLAATIREITDGGSPPRQHPPCPECGACMADHPTHADDHRKGFICVECGQRLGYTNASVRAGTRESVATSALIRTNPPWKTVGRIRHRGKFTQRSVRASSETQSGLVCPPQQGRDRTRGL